MFQALLKLVEAIDQLDPPSTKHPAIGVVVNELLWAVSKKLTPEQAVLNIEKQLSMFDK